MKILALAIVMSIASVGHADTAEEKAVKAYYAGFETHNWNQVAATLADGFTFTTQVNDHTTLKDFKQSCWPTNKFMKKVSLVEMVHSGDEILLLVEIKTTDGKQVRNIDRYAFSGGKIKSIEVFFGPGESYPGRNAK
ncbi:MAG TPA: nuclear transport factor 2 family protein [Kofleriaceae bacterium]